MPCYTGTLHDGIGGGIRICPGATHDQATLIVGLGEGAGGGVGYEPRDTVPHVSLHSEVAWGAGPVQGGVQSDLPLASHSDGPDAGVFAGISPVGPRLDLTASREGVSASGSLTGDSDDDKQSSDKTTGSDGRTANEGAQASSDLYIPIPTLPTQGTWSYRIWRPMGNKGLSIPIFFGF